MTPEKRRGPARMPGQHRVGRRPTPGFAPAPPVPAPADAPRSIDQIPAAFRKPLRPPTKEST